MGATIHPSSQPSSQVQPNAAGKQVDAAPSRTHTLRREWLAVLAGRALFGTLLVVLLVAPFEVGYPPLGRVLWTTYTNLEAALFIMVGAWLLVMLVDAGARLRLLKLPLLWPMLALVAACGLSTFFGEYKSLGVQFTYRLVIGMLMLAVGWETLCDRRRLLVATGMFVASGTIAALTGLLEFVPWVNVQPWLQVFKPQPTTVGGMLRLSGTFEYANGAAAFFEMALPVLLGLIGATSLTWLARDQAGNRGVSRWRKLPMQVALYLALAALTMALMLTFSRAAWLGALVALALFGTAILRKRRSERTNISPPLMRSLGLALCVIVLGGIYIYLTHPLLALRLVSENDSSWYKNTITEGAVPSLYAGNYITVPVTVRNDGPMLWHSDRAPVVHFSYHWRQAGKSDYTIFEGERTPLPRDVGPGESVSVEALVLAPPKSGTYQLEWDLVQEDVTWFYQKSRSRVEPVSLAVLPSIGKTPVTLPQKSPYPPVSIVEIENYDASTIPRAQLWKAAFAMFLAHPITGVGPDGFRNLYGKYVGKTDWNRNIYTNNTYIEMFTNLGLLGGLSFLWLVGIALLRSIRSLLNESVSAAWVVGLGATSALVAFLVHGFADYFLFSTPLYIAFWFILAVTLCSSRFKVQSEYSVLEP